MQLSDTAILVFGLLLAAWVAAAIWAIMSGLAMRRRAQGVLRQSRRLSRMIDESPALPLLVRADGRLEGPDLIAQWLGLSKMPAYLSELSADGAGLEEADRELLATDIAHVQKSGATFERSVRAQGANRVFVLRGTIANPQVSPASAALIWIFDATKSEGEIHRLEDEVTQSRSAFEALSGLIEAAPIPMWHRTTDLRLSLVNSAYVSAVGGTDAASVVAGGVELVETIDGVTPMAVAARAMEDRESVERTVATTIGDKRRVLKVVDLPIGEAGIAGYAIDIQEMEEVRTEFRRFRASQRDMLDTMSAAFAQFDAKQELLFCNQPFQRIFNMRPQWVQPATPFARILDRMRESGCIPEVRDFPEWREEKHGWFRVTKAAEENWLLPDGTHLRVIAHPTPDGGLLLIFEDRTEQVQLASARDSLLRARTATFDNLFEALAVFSPDGKLHLWNRRFSDIWKLDESKLAEHPRIDDLMRLLAPRLRRSARISALRNVVRSATSDREEKSGKIEMGDSRIFEFAGIPLPDGNALFTMLDITDNERIEQALRDRNDALVEADAVKGKFLANMSYELRTPLTSIGGFAELLDSGIAGPLTDQGKEYVTAILESVERLGSQINNVLDMSQSEAGTLPLSRQEVDMTALLKSVVRDRENAVEKGELELDLRLSSKPEKLSADPKRIAQAIGNVLDNSIAYTPVGGRILVQVDKQGERLRIVVSDDGPGMDAKATARALDGFGMREGGKSRRKSRTGLGLPLSKQLVEAHGGQLELLSEPGQGTLVTILLPCA